MVSQQLLTQHTNCFPTAPRWLTSGCLRRRCRFMDARVDTFVPQRWHDWASTFSWVRWTCFCSMYSVRYFLSHVAHVHVLPTAARKREAGSIQDNKCTDDSCRTNQPIIHSSTLSVLQSNYSKLVLFFTCCWLHKSSCRFTSQYTSLDVNIVGEKKLNYRPPGSAYNRLRIASMWLSRLVSTRRDMRLACVDKLVCL